MKTALTIGGVFAVTGMLAALCQTPDRLPGARLAPERAGRAVPVSLAGLDLTETSDAAVALERLRGAADGACFGGNAALRPDRSAQGCREAALSAAVSAVGAPTLTVLHRSQIRVVR